MITFNQSKSLGPGILTATLIALAAKFLSFHYGMPAMLLALLLGLAMNSLFKGTPAEAGVSWASNSLLRFSVGLLGVGINYDLIMELGLTYLLLTVASVGLVIGFGILCARTLGKGAALGILTGGATSICGASAAVAISSVLPQHADSEKHLTATVFAVTVLSTLAMITYPIVTTQLGYSDALAGAFLGATIHDVAQVVGAGLSISDDAGTTAVLVKLFRVAMLAPVVLIISFWAVSRRIEIDASTSTPIIPSFVILFFILASLNSLNAIPSGVTQLLSAGSSWGLLIAIAAVGMKTSVRDFWASGSTVIYLVIGQTLLLAVAFVLAIYVLGLT